MSTSPIASASSAFDEPAGEDQVLGLRRADQPGQPLGAAGAGDDAEQHLGLAEDGVLGCEPHVGGERELAAPAQRVAGDGRDHGLRDPGDRGDRALQRAGALDHVRVGHVGHLLDVVAGGEDPLPAVHDDGAYVVALGGLGGGRPQLVLHLEADGVHLRPVQPDRADAVRDLEPDVLTHLLCLLDDGAATVRRRCARHSASIGDNDLGEPWHLDASRSARPGLARTQLAARRDLVAGVDELRGLRPQRHRVLAVRLRRRGRRDPPPADRAVPRHLARRAARHRPGHPLRLPRRRAVGPRARGSGSTRTKLLLDPYALATARTVRPEPPLFGYVFDDPSARDEHDSAPYTARSVVVDTTFDWEGDAPMRRRWRDTVIYEAHVKGMTQLHDRRPEELRGTYAGFATPAVVDYLRDLGVTAVELLPIQQFFSEPALVERGHDELLGLQHDQLLRPPRGATPARATAARQVARVQAAW